MTIILSILAAILAPQVIRLKVRIERASTYVSPEYL